MPTMAKLATGIKRFKLPEEQNYIALQRRIVENSEGSSSQWQQAKSSLAQEFENRRQYPRAAQEWKELFASAPTSTPYRERFEQIVVCLPHEATFEAYRRALARPSSATA